MLKLRLYVTTGVLVILSFYFLAPVSYSGETVTAGAIAASATIASEFTFKIRIENQNPIATTTTMNFGELVRASDSELQAPTFYKVYAEMNTLGAPSHLTQTATQLVRNGGSETMPNGAFIIKPTYDLADNNNQPKPAGATLLGVQTAVGTKEVYADPTGAHRTVTILYYLSGDSTVGATQKITFDQKSGGYSGTIEYTLASD